MDLTNALNVKSNDVLVYSIDDGYLLSGGSSGFEFKNIAEVASEAVTLIHQIISRHNYSGSIILSGWSYGGVVAALTTKLLANSKIVVSHLVLYDAPIFGDVVTEQHGGELPSTEVEDVSRRHFTLCTGLLNEYYKESHFTSGSATLILQKCKMLVICAETEESASYQPNYAIGNYECITSESGMASVVQLIRSRGTHWTMLTGENSCLIANAVHEFTNS